MSIFKYYAYSPYNSIFAGVAVPKYLHKTAFAYI